MKSPSSIYLSHRRERKIIKEKPEKGEITILLLRDQVRESIMQREGITPLTSVVLHGIHSCYSNQMVCSYLKLTS